MDPDSPALGSITRGGTCVLVPKPSGATTSLKSPFSAVYEDRVKSYPHRKEHSFLGVLKRDHFPARVTVKLNILTLRGETKRLSL